MLPRRAIPITTTNHGSMLASSTTLDATTTVAEAETETAIAIATIVETDPVTGFIPATRNVIEAVTTKKFPGDAAVLPLTFAAAKDWPTAPGLSEKALTTVAKAPPPPCLMMSILNLGTSVIALRRPTKRRRMGISRLIVDCHQRRKQQIQPPG